MRINPSFAQQGSSRPSLEFAANALNKPLLCGVVQQFHVTRSRSNSPGVQYDSVGIEIFTSVRASGARS